MAAPYIPNKDQDLSAWLANFNTLIGINPGLYGLTAGDAAVINTASLAFITALTTATDPSTRTKATVAAKDGQRASTLGTIRPYAIQIRNNAGVTNLDKLALGLTVPDLTPTPIPAPSTSPILTIIAATPGQLTLRFADQNSPALRQKPFGATALEVHAIASASPVVDPLLIPFQGLATKNPYPISFGSGDDGKTASVVGRWVTRRGLVGPWSAIVFSTVWA